MKSFLSKTLMLAVASLTLAGCDLDGSLSVNQDLQLRNRKGVMIPLQANRTYKASIEKDDGQLQIEVKVNGDTKTFKIRPPAGQQVPKEEGEIFVTAAQAGQPVDIHGILNTDYDRSADRRGTRQCSEQVQVRVCNDVLRTRPDGSTYYDRVCGYQYQTQYGSQDIEYHNLTTTVTGEVRMLNPGTQNEAAKFFGRKSSSEQVVTWSGRCHLNGGGYDSGDGYDRDPRDRRDPRDDRGPRGGGRRRY